MNNITGFPQYSVKYYREDLYKLIKFNKLLIPRLKDSPASDVEDSEPSDGKLINNLIRARGVIQQIALCNEWPFFCTFTIDKESMIGTISRLSIRLLLNGFVTIVRSISAV